MILAIDQGTTGTTCLVFDEDGAAWSARAYREFAQHFPRPGWVEHDAAEIWDVTRAVAREALDAAGIAAGDLRGDRDHQPARDRRGWDRRTRRAAPPRDRLAGPPHRRPLRAAARSRATSRWCGSAPGLVIDPYFSGTKIEWMLEQRRRPARTRRAGGACFGTIDAWLAFKLTGRAVDRLLERVADDAVRHPQPALGRRSCATLLGVPRRGAARGAPLRARLTGETRPRRVLRRARCPLAGIAGDQQAALFGQACIAPGSARTPTAPAASCSLNAGRRAAAGRAPGLLTTVAWGIGGRDRLRARGERLRDRAPPSSGCATGSGIIAAAAETEAMARVARLERRRLLRAGADRASARRTGTPTRAARSSGSRAAPAARTSRARRSRRSPTRPSTPSRRWRRRPASGSPSCAPTAARSPTRWLMQFQADVLGRPVVVPEIAETTALGAAYLAGVGTGPWTLEQVARAVARGRALRAADGRGRARALLARVAAGGRARPRTGRPSAV